MMSSPLSRSLLCGKLFAFMVATLSGAVTVSAADVTWSGGGGDNNWGTALNWGGVVPVAGDGLSFGGTTRLTSVNNLTADINFAGLTFNSDAGAFVLSGARINLGGNVTNNSASLQTLNLAMILDATRTFDTGTSNLTVGGVLSGNGGLNKAGSGTLTLNGSAANTYAGLTTVSAGQLTLDKTAGVNAVAGNLDISGGARVVMGKAHQIADGSLVTVSGAGSVFNGTGINAGMPSSQVETIGGLTLTGGTFNAGGNAVWNITGAGSFVGGAGNSLFVGNSGARLTFGSLSISGMAATAAATVTTANSFTLYGNSGTLSSITVGSGGLMLEASRLNLRRGNAGTAGSKLVLNGNVTVAGTGLSEIVEDTAGGSGGIARLELGGTADPVAREFNVGTGASLNVGVDITNGASSQAGLTKTGNGSLTLSGPLANTYTGATLVNGGTLVLNKTANINAVPGDIVVNIGGTLSMTANEQIPDGAGITVAGGTIAAWGRNETLTHYTQNAGGVTASGNTGQVTISGAMTLAGGTTFTINSSAVPAHFQTGSLVMTGADVLIGGNNGTGNGRTALSVGSGGLSMNGRTITLYRGTGGTVLNLNGNFTGTGSNSIVVQSTGVVEPELNLGAGIRTFDITSGTTTINVGIVGSGGLNKTGAGTLAFTGGLANTYTGTTTVSGGILNLNHTAGIDAIAGGLEVATGGTLTLSASEQIANTSGGITMNGGLISAFTTTETLAYYTQNSGGFNASGNTGNLVVTGLVTLAGGNTMTINSGGSNPPAWQFNAANLTGAGILVGGNNGVGNPKTTLTIGAGGLVLAGRPITLNGGNAGVSMYLLGDVTATGSSAITLGTAGAVNPELHLGTGTRTFQISNGTTTLGVEVMDAAAILKTGSGTLLMTTANSYSGGTTVNAGTLRITNAGGSAIGTGPLVVGLAGTLNGTGRAAPAAGQNITVNGIVSVGNPGAVTGETLTLSTAGLGKVEIGGRVIIDLFGGQANGGLNAASAADRLVLASQTAVALTPGSVLNVTTSIPINAANTAGWVPGTSWQIIDWSGLAGTPTGTFGNLTGEVGNFVNLPDLSPMGYSWDLSSLYTTGVIVVAVPEPGRGALFAVASLALLGRRRRILG